MTAPRSRLSLRTRASLTEEEKAALLGQAMEHHLRVRWTYNRTRMQAAPQLLYRRNDSLYCEAVVVERDGMVLHELKLGSFNLAGLQDLALTSEAFTPVADIDTDDARYAGGIVARA